MDIPRAVARQCLVLAVVVLGLAPQALWAQDGAGLRIHGFGTLGLVNAEADFGGQFRRDISQSTDDRTWHANLDSRFGVQVNYALHEKLELVAQVVLRERNYANTAQDAVEWAFASYRPTPDTTLRVGRTGLDLFLASDYRNVGFAYTTARPNIDFYGVLPYSGVNGIDVAQRWTLGDADWRLKAFAGSSRYAAGVGSSSIQKGDMRELIGFVVSRETQGLLLRATAVRTRLESSSPEIVALNQGLEQLAAAPLPSVAQEARALAQQVRLQQQRVSYASLGMAYDRNNWLLNTEIARTRSDTQLVSIRSGYVTLGRRLGSVTLHGGLSAVRSDYQSAVVPQWGQALAPFAALIGGQAVVQQAQALGEAAAGLVNSARVDQRTFSLGLRWDLDPRIALKLQWDHVKVAPQGGLIWGGSSTGGHANIGSVVLDFLF